jgi:hypothetical protein
MARFTAIVGHLRTKVCEVSGLAALQRRSPPVSGSSTAPVVTLRFVRSGDRPRWTLVGPHRACRGVDGNVVKSRGPDILVRRRSIVRHCRALKSVIRAASTGAFLSGVVAMHPQIGPVASPGLRPAPTAHRTNAPAPPGIHVDPVMWERLVATDADALIIGEGFPVSRVLNFLWPRLRKPIFCSDGRRLVLPIAQEGTLFLEHANRLTVSDQQRVLEWRLSNRSQVRILAVASSQPPATIEPGAFGQRLSEPLNGVLLLVPWDRSPVRDGGVSIDPTTSNGTSE